MANETGRAALKNTKNEAINKAKKLEASANRWLAAGLAGITVAIITAGALITSHPEQLCIPTAIGVIGLFATAVGAATRSEAKNRQEFNK